MRWIPCAIFPSRSPHGERGLKFAAHPLRAVPAWSLSSWRAWIEIEMAEHDMKVATVALLMESVD